MLPTLEDADGRVRLRPLRDDDLAFCHAMANDPDLRGWLRFERPMGLEDERAWMGDLDESKDRVWMMEEPATGRRMGLVSLNGWDHVARHAEVGLAIVSPEDRGRGVGGASLRLVLRHAFADLNLQRVHLRVHDDNPARRLYERLGFREEGLLRRHVHKRGAWRDLVLMGLLREEWRG